MSNIRNIGASTVEDFVAALVAAMSTDTLQAQTSGRRHRPKRGTLMSAETGSTTYLVPTMLSPLVADSASGNSFTCASNGDTGSGVTVEGLLQAVNPTPGPGASRCASSSGSNGAPGSGATAQAFDGAALAAQNPPQLWSCEDCGKAFAVISMLAYLTPDNKAAVLPSNDNRVNRALRGPHGEGATSQNLCVRDEPRLVCLYCCETYHKTTYLGPGGKPTSAFKSMTKRSSGCHKQDPSSVKWIVNLHDKKIEQDTGERPDLSSMKIYKSLREADIWRKGIDWVTMCGGLLSVKYGCLPCKHYPLSSAGFYRCTHWSPSAEAGFRTGFWVCANCVEKWSWPEQGAYRLLTIGSTESIAEGQYLFAHVRENVSRDNVHLMSFMKTCSLLSHIDGKPLSEKVILQAISELNSAQEKKMCAGVKEVVTFKAKRIPNADWQLYCESERLSIRREGGFHKAIDVSLVKPEIPMLTDEWLTTILDFAAAALDIDMSAHLPPAMQESRRKLMSRDSYQMACKRLRAICNQAMPEPAAPLLQIKSTDPDSDDNT